MIKILKQLLLKPQEFFKGEAGKKVGNTPYFWLLLFLYFIGIYVYKIQEGVLVLATINTVVILLIILIGVYIHFMFSSFVYNVRIRLSGGDGDFPTSQRIVLYSKIFLNSFLAILFPIIVFYTYKAVLGEDETYFLGVIISSLVMIWGGLLFYYHAISISYRSIKNISNVTKWGARIWFLFLPIIGVTFVALVSSAVLFSGF